MSDLATMVDAIVTAVYDRIQSEADEAIQAVVRGSSVRPLPKMPALWVIPMPAKFKQEAYGVWTYDMPITIAALVKGTDPAATATLSQTYAAAALSNALGTERLSGVTDIVPESFDPTAHSSESNRTLFWTEATVLVTFDCTT